MNETKRAQIVELVREKDRIEAEMRKLKARDSDLDARIDALLNTPEPKEKAPKSEAPAEPRKKGRPPGRKKPAAAPAAEAKTPAEKKPATTQKGQKGQKGQRGKKGKRGRKRAAGGPAGAGINIKDRLLAMLRSAPKGVEVGALAREVYGSDAAAVRAKCEGYLYNLARKKLVAHEGTKWYPVPSAG